MLLLKQRLPPAYLGVFCYSGLRNQRANHLASQRDLPSDAPMGRLDPSPRGGAAFFHFWGANEPTFSSAVNHIGPRVRSLWARDQREGTWPGGKARIRVPPQSSCIVARSSSAYDHAGAVHRARCGGYRAGSVRQYTGFCQRCFRDELFADWRLCSTGRRAKAQRGDADPTRYLRLAATGVNASSETAS